MTDASGATAWRAEYDPYGGVYTVRTGSSLHQPLRFPGQTALDGTDTYYNIFRHYRSGWGRYTQPDPLGLNPSLNLYAYVDDAPVNSVDPLGLSKNPSSMNCCELRQEADKLSNELGRRVGEEERIQRLLRGGILQRSTIANLIQYLGHLMQFAQKKVRLVRVIEAMKNKGCGDPPAVASEWATRTYPDVGYIYELYKAVLARDMTALNNLLEEAGSCGCSN